MNNKCPDCGGTMDGFQIGGMECWVCDCGNVEKKVEYAEVNDDRT